MPILKCKIAFWLAFPVWSLWIIELLQQLQLNILFFFSTSYYYLLLTANNKDVFYTISTDMANSGGIVQLDVFDWATDTFNYEQIQYQIHQ